MPVNLNMAAEKGGSIAGYYGQQKETGYYQSEGQTVTAVWHGKGLANYGLKSGDIVDGKVLDNIAKGYDASGNTALATNAGAENRRNAYDLSFSIDKSVSVAYFLSNDDVFKEKVDKVLDKAHKATMDFVEKNLVTIRVTDENGNIARISADNLVYATYKHNFSRANDPQLHFHTVIANTVTYDGKQYTLSNEDIIDAQRTLNHIFNNEIAKGFLESGINYTRSKFGDTGVAGVSDELIKLFSQRQDAIDKKVAEYNKDGLYKELSEIEKREIAAKETRDPKDLNKTNDEIIAEIQERAKEFNFSDEFTKAQAEKQGRPENFEIELRQISTGVMRDLTDKEAVIEKKQLINEIMIRADISNYQDALNELKNNPVFKKLDDNHFTTQDVMNSEIAVRDGLLSGINTRDAIATKAEVEQSFKAFKEKNGFELSDEQKNAVGMVLTTKDRFVNIQGVAGAGKTTLLQAIDNFKNVVQTTAEEKGFKFIGVSFQGKAADGIGQAVKSNMVYTLDSFVNIDISKIDKNTIIAMDEASMTGTEHYKKIVDIVNKTGALLIAIGDTNQIQSIKRGKDFELSQKYMQTAFIGKSNRQKDHTYKNYTEVVRQFYIDPKAAIQQLNADGKITEIADEKTRLDAMLEKYFEQAKIVGKDAVNMVVSTNVKKDYLNDKVVEQGIKDKEISNIQDKMISNSMTFDLRYAKNYEIGDKIFVQDGTEFGTEYKVKEIDKNANVLTLENITNKLYEKDNYGRGRALKHTKKELNQIKQNTKDNLTITEKKQVHTDTLSIFGLRHSKTTATNTKQMVYKLELGYVDENLLKKIGGVYREKDLKLGKGMNVMFLKNEMKGLKVRNGQTGTVLSLKGDNIKIKMDGDGRTVKVNLKEYNYFDRYYAMTVPKSQGGTIGNGKEIDDKKVGVAIIDLDTKYTNKNAALVGNTRAVSDVYCFTNDLKKLEFKVGIAQEKTSYLEFMANNLNGNYDVKRLSDIELKDFQNMHTAQLGNTTLSLINDKTALMLIKDEKSGLYNLLQVEKLDDELYSKNYGVELVKADCEFNDGLNYTANYFKGNSDSNARGLMAHSIESITDKQAYRIKELTQDIKELEYLNSAPLNKYSASAAILYSLAYANNDDVKYFVNGIDSEGIKTEKEFNEKLERSINSISLINTTAKADNKPLSYVYTALLNTAIKELTDILPEQEKEPVTVKDDKKLSANELNQFVNDRTTNLNETDKLAQINDNTFLLNVKTGDNEFTTLKLTKAKPNESLIEKENKIVSYNGRMINIDISVDTLKKDNEPYKVEIVKIGDLRETINHMASYDFKFKVNTDQMTDKQTARLDKLLKDTPELYYFNKQDLNKTQASAAMGFIPFYKELINPQDEIKQEINGEIENKNIDYDEKKFNNDKINEFLQDRTVKFGNDRITLINDKTYLILSKTETGYNLMKVSKLDDKVYSTNYGVESVKTNTDIKDAANYMINFFNANADKNARGIIAHKADEITEKQAFRLNEIVKDTKIENIKDMQLNKYTASAAISYSLISLSNKDFKTLANNDNLKETDKMPDELSIEPDKPKEYKGAAKELIAFCEYLKPIDNMDKPAPEPLNTEKDYNIKKLSTAELNGFIDDRTVKFNDDRITLINSDTSLILSKAENGYNLMKATKLDDKVYSTNYNVELVKSNAELKDAVNYMANYFNDNSDRNARGIISHKTEPMTDKQAFRLNEIVKNTELENIKDTELNKYTASAAISYSLISLSNADFKTFSNNVELKDADKMQDKLVLEPDKDEIQAQDKELFKDDKIDIDNILSGIKVKFETKDEYKPVEIKDIFEPIGDIVSFLDPEYKAPEKENIEPVIEKEPVIKQEPSTVEQKETVTIEYGKEPEKVDISLKEQKQSVKELFKNESILSRIFDRPAPAKVIDIDKETEKEIKPEPKEKLKEPAPEPKDIRDLIKPDWQKDKTFGSLYANRIKAALEQGLSLNDKLPEKDLNKDIYAIVNTYKKELSKDDMKTLSLAFNVIKGNDIKEFHNIKEIKDFVKSNGELTKQQEMKLFNSNKLTPEQTKYAVKTFTGEINKEYKDARKDIINDIKNIKLDELSKEKIEQIAEKLTDKTPESKDNAVKDITNLIKDYVTAFSDLKQYKAPEPKEKEYTKNELIGKLDNALSQVSEQKQDREKEYYDMLNKYVDDYISGDIEPSNDNINRNSDISQLRDESKAAISNLRKDINNIYGERILNAITNQRPKGALRNLYDIIKTEIKEFGKDNDNYLER